LITGLIMPVMDGFATIRALRSLNPGIRIIASSGLGLQRSGPPAVWASSGLGLQRSGGSGQNRRVENASSGRPVGKAIQRFKLVKHSREGAAQALALDNQLLIPSRRVCAPLGVFTLKRRVTFHNACDRILLFQPSTATYRLAPGLP
jgi:CheY-like chemotaxis protein